MLMATSPDSLPSANILIVVSHTRFSPKQNKVSIESIVKMAHGPVTAVVMFLIACHRTLAINLQSKTEVEELSFNKRSVSCNQLTPNSTIYWTISPIQGQVKKVGTCGVVTCKTPYPSNVNLKRPSLTSSSLTLLNVSREWAGTVVCTERLLNGTEQSVNSTLDVYHNSGVSNSSFVINREDWSLTVIVTVPKVFSALGNYGVEVRCLEMTSKVNVSLVSYNESSRMYNVGYFSVTLRANFTGYKNRYKDISPYSCFSNIFLHPGTKRYLEAQWWHNYLSTPNIRCNQSYIPEEGPVSCSCTSTFKYHPDARLRWMLEEKVVSSGDYGVEWLLLPPEVVNRSHDGKILECEVEWLYNERDVHWIDVAYGPDTVSIQYLTISTPGKCLVILTCEAPVVNPLSYDMFEWGGMCEGQQGSRCIIIAVKEEDDGNEVTCIVTNYANHERTASASVTLMLSGCEVKDDLMGKVVGIGIGVTLTLVLLVVGVVVVVVIWRRRRYQQDTIYEQPSQDPGLSHTYEMTRAGHDPRTPESEEQIAVAPTPPCEVYENVSSDITAKPVKAKQQRKTQKQ